MNDVLFRIRLCFPSLVFVVNGEGDWCIVLLLPSGGVIDDEDEDEDEDEEVRAAPSLFARNKPLLLLYMVDKSSLTSYKNQSYFDFGVCLGTLVHLRTTRLQQQHHSRFR